MSAAWVTSLGRLGRPELKRGVHFQAKNDMHVCVYIHVCVVLSLSKSESTRAGPMATKKLNGRKQSFWQFYSFTLPQETNTTTTSFACFASHLLQFSVLFFPAKSKHTHTHSNTYTRQQFGPMQRVKQSGVKNRRTHSFTYCSFTCFFRWLQYFHFSPGTLPELIHVLCFAQL